MEAVNISSKHLHDVLLDGTLIGVSDHGNSYFTDLLLLHSQEFADCDTEQEKTEIACRIWTKIVDERKGRFLVSSPRPNTFQVLDKAAVVGKVCQAIKDLVPMSQQEPRLVKKQLRLLEQEVTKMKEDRRRLHHDLSLVLKDCAVFQREIIALKHACIDFRHDIKEIQEVQRSQALAWPRGDCSISSRASLRSRIRGDLPRQAFCDGLPASIVGHGSLLRPGLSGSSLPKLLDRRDTAFSDTKDHTSLCGQVAARGLKRKAIAGHEYRRMGS